ncbi:MAG TPA: ABC transporter ATP-binding protein [Candidatus Saccharimonadia bacterium]|nr:ABC transporter ATP-binding protein [Candidatus Saccharimonadia bacterium]
MSVLVRLDGVGKSYPRVFRRADRLRALGSLLVGRAPAHRTPVLEGVDLEVRRGESLGIVGENGAGKSTLLKLITGVLAPSAGTIAVDGTFGALLELGAGFHPEYSGRENIRLAGTLMGFTDAELTEATPRIEAFADIGDYLDEPVKHYSSGMVVRLGFALVAARRPDLLITDEVLAVGDEAFQRKCIRWIEDYLAQGGTLLLVAHSMYHVQKLCRHALWLHRGRVEAHGDVFDVTQRYLAYLERRTARDEARTHAGEGTEFQVRSIALDGDRSLGGVAIEQGASLAVEVELASASGREPTLAIGLVRADGTAVCGIGSEIDGARGIPCAGGFRFRVVFDRIALLPGSYQVRAHVMDPEALRVFDTQERPLAVRGRTRELGIVHLPHRWDTA